MELWLLFAAQMVSSEREKNGKKKRMDGREHGEQSNEVE